MSTSTSTTPSTSTEPSPALAGDELPQLAATTLTIIEAGPSPAPGPTRDVLAAEAAARVQRAEDTMTTAAQAFTERVANVVLARLRGPRARKGTRYWATRQSKVAAGAEWLNLETKALDGQYIVPSKLIDEIDEAMRPVAMRVALDAAADTAARVLPDGSGVLAEEDMFSVDQDLLSELVGDAVEHLIGTAEGYAEAVRDAIVEGDRDQLEFDDLLGQVEQTLERTGRWVHLSARTTATALAGRAALEQARILGVTHTQWISRRDGRVRPSHVRADGQVRAIGEHFRVGRHELQYPGDPTGLPLTAEEVHNCRCGLLFAPPDPRVGQALMDTARSAVGDDQAVAAVEAALAAARGAQAFVPVPGELGIPDLASEVTLPTDVVGWRMLTAAVDVRAGQRIRLPGGTALGLAPPQLSTAAAMSVVIPAGVRVGISGGALVLLDDAEVEVLSATGDGLQTALL